MMNNSLFNGFENAKRKSTESRKLRFEAGIFTLLIIISWISLNNQFMAGRVFTSIAIYLITGVIGTIWAFSFRRRFRKICATA